MQTRSSPFRPRGGRPAARPRTTARLTAAALMTAALLVSACSPGSSSIRPSSAASTRPDAAAAPVLAPLPRAIPAALTPYYTQRLQWRDCGAPGFQCATMKAPLDYARPGAGDVRLAVTRKAATGSARPLGSLLVNPGGPGGSAVDYLQQYAGLGYPAEVRARYDMVAMDPRGVARSEPVECLGDRQMDTYTQTDVTPDDRAEEDAAVAADEKFARACGAHSARLLRHVSTVEVARDMDVLRAALGDAKLNYVGASYGTFLGATYAGLFPSRVGRVVLDGALDPSLDSRTVNLEQARGFETAFQAFTEDCVRRADCPLGGSGTTPRQAADHLRSFFRKLDGHPVPAGDRDGRKLGEALATTGVIAAMYDEGAWSRLRAALTSATKGDGAALLALSDSYYERDADGHYSNLMMANNAVNCLDLPPAFTGPRQVEQARTAFEKASPVFGEGLAWSSLNCAYWPVRATGEPHRITARGAAPIVVVGTVRDPATPYRWAQSLAHQLTSGHLLTYDGDGHTAFLRGSNCVDSAIGTYLLHGTPPPPGKRCS
ncbi:alpha/beta hydrolase [Streptomyces sp. KHY 26]|uniref:alpha/beta hydrolase n=1 Tax=Streptomyces sp. KHY 26 TaxID=3097359 RepID=UPI00376F37B0